MLLRRWKETDNTLDQSLLRLTHREIGGRGISVISDRACLSSLEQHIGRVLLAESYCQSPTQTRACTRPRFSLLCPTPGVWSRSLSLRLDGQSKRLLITIFFLCRGACSVPNFDPLQLLISLLAGHSNRIVDV